jgi:hypothetical protein
VSSNEAREEIRFGRLHDRKIRQMFALNDTRLAMGELLDAWGPDDATLAELAGQYGYTVIELEEMMHTASRSAAMNDRPRRIHRDN